MECDQCGARRPRSGPCPECGAPAPGNYSSMRQWRDQSRSGQGPAVGRSSGANWGGSAASSSRMRSPRNGWDEGGYEEEPPARSSASNRRRGNYEEVDLERALVPSQNMLPMDPNAMGMGAGLPALPGMPQTDEEERAIGIRRPVYVPATGEKRKKKLGTWRVVSGVMSVMLICIASCGAAALFGRNVVTGIINPPIKVYPTVQAYSTANVPVTPVATVGPQSKYVYSIVTSNGVSQNFTPTDQTSHFQANTLVDVVCEVHGIAKGAKHTISIHWFYDGQDLNLTNGHVSQVVTTNQVVYFALTYPEPGLGMAKVYFDLPNDAHSDQATAPFLAGQIYFAIDPANAPTPGTTTPGKSTPTGTKSATPTKTPVKTATPTALFPGSPPVAWVAQRRDDAIG
jgi:hypothetical protein